MESGENERGKGMCFRTDSSLEFEAETELEAETRTKQFQREGRLSRIDSVDLLLPQTPYSCLCSEIY